MTLRIATWNINSLRLRLRELKRVAKLTAADVICLQEIKVTNEDFPHDAIAALGFDHQIVRGMKSYNGVAIISRLPMEEGDTRQWCGLDDSRHVVARIGHRLEIHNFYVPAGGDIPDPEQNDKFAHKLRFLSEMAGWLGSLSPHPRVLAGDLNVAPLETDVWSHKQLLKVISHTPVETENLERVRQSLNWVDAVRRFIPPSEQLYTWWSYRNRTWPGSDRGRRLDHLWVTPDLTGNLRNAEVHRSVRGWKNASDHVPVSIELGI